MKNQNDLEPINEPNNHSYTALFSQDTIKLVVIAAFLAFIIKFSLAIYTVGTNDIFYFKMFLNIANDQSGIELYKNLAWYNHPPMMLHYLRLLGLLENLLHLDFHFLFRSVLILADLGSLFLTYKILKLQNKTPILALILLALAPVSIMVSGFHGNTDPLFIFFVLLSVYILELDENALPKILPIKIVQIMQNNRVYLAAMAIAIATNIKIVPVILFPCLWFYLPNIKTRLKYFLTAAFFWGILSSPFIIQDFPQILKNTFGYGSFYSTWGFSRIFFKTFPFDHWVNVSFRDNGKYLIVIGIFLISFLMNYKKKIPLFAQIGFVFYFFMSFTSGFSVQYLVWLAPWVLFLGVEATSIFLLTSGLFLFGAYNWWSAGLPWNLGSTDIETWGGVIIEYDLIAWGAVVLIMLAYSTYIISEKNTAFNLWLSKLKEKKLIPIFTALILIIVGIKGFNDFVINYGSHLFVIDGKTKEIRDKQLFESTYNKIGQFYLQSKSYGKAIESYEKVLEINLYNVTAYNNLSVSFIALKEWKKAREVCKKALVLDPNSQTAKDNLAFIENQMKKFSP
jgi:tetratricopeptide (TPR) repeat protein